MRLDKLEISGFKSFKDKTMLEFPDNFTTIVGPNGSGKSNIIDSICFVLGRSRGLRVNNMSDLICNGGMEGKKSDYAKVSMFLLDDNGGGAKLTREITKDGRSIYKLDDKRTTRQEMIELIGDAEYNILLQDDVTKLIDMHPTQRREIIDDLCGIREYDEKKKKALKELEKVENRISDTYIVLGEKEGYLGQLKNQRDEALKYQELQKDLGNLKASLIYNNMCNHQKRIDSLDEDIKKLDEEREENKINLNKLRTEIDDRNTKLKEINAEILRIERERGGSELQSMREDLIRLENQLQNTQNELETKEGEKTNTLGKKKTLEKELEEVDSRIKRVDEKIGELGVKIDEETKKAGGLETEEKIDELKNKIFKLHSNVNLNIEKNDEGLKEIEALESEKEKQETRIKELLVEEKGLAQAVDDKLVENRTNFELYEQLREKIPALEKKRETVLRNLNNLKVKVTEKKTEIKTLESSSGGLRGAITAIMKLTDVIGGIHGIVSQLGSVTNKEYETALQIAAGQGMQYIVVENPDVATKCIEYLRSKKIGRSTFLPLNKLKIKLKDSPPNGSLGFARDLIKTDKKFKAAFNYIFRDTIVVENLDKAKKIGFGKWRMVTLDGDLILPSGAMTGGYLKKEKLAAMSFSSTEAIEKEIKALERRIIELDGEQQKLEIERRKLEDRLTKIEQPVASGKTDVEKIKLEKENMKEKREELKERAEKIVEEIKDNRRKIKERNSEVKSYERDASTLEKTLEKLISKRTEKGVEKLEELKDKYRNLEVEKGRMDEKRNLIVRQDNEIKLLIESLEEDISSVKPKIDEYSKSYDTLKTELEGLEKENRALIKELEEFMDKRSEMQDSVTEAGSRIGEMEYFVEELNDRLNKASVDKARLETKLADLEEEFKEYEGYDPVEGKVREMQSKVEEIGLILESFESVNLKAIESYDILKNEIDETTGKIETLKTERESIFEFMEKVERKKRDVFMEAFEVVNKNFTEIYQELADGNGALTLDNPRDISESGLVINASPEGKKLVNIDAMSGGEKVVTCSAFMLAIQRYKPSHFYIVDELDAALDLDNSLRLARMLKKSDSQFVMITHNESVIKHAESVIGVTMNNGISEIVGVKLS